MQCKIKNQMWHVLKSEYVKQKKQDLIYTKIDKNSALADTHAPIQ